MALGALFAPPTARAGEYCNLNVDFMKDCSYGSMEQCKATAAGMNGICSRDPFLKDNSIATINRNAYAYVPFSSAHNGRSPAAKAYK